MRMITLLLAAVAALLAACNSDSNSTPTEERPAREARDGSEPFIDKDAVARVNRIEDARITVYEPRTRVTSIMVSSRHRDLENREGRLRIVGGNLRQGFKRISDLQFDAMLQSFSGQDEAVAREPFTREHERLLKVSDGEVPGFKGIVVVENAGERWAYVGRRPAHRQDDLGVRKLQIYSNIKLLAWTAYNSENFVEYVDQGGLGESGGGLGR